MAGAKRKPLVAGNWKMNGLQADARALKAMIKAAGKPSGYGCDLLICPPAPLIAGFSEIARGSALRVGGQDCHPRPSGAHTGDISAESLRDAGGKAVIVGHSERRQDHGESDALVRAKAEAVRRAGLLAIICIGETLTQRDGGETLEVVGRQLQGSVPDGATGADTVIAYEPVWAIGTGRTPTPEEIAAVHAAIRGQLADRFGAEGGAIRILYGGSVKPENAAQILPLPDVDGALVGGASLKATDFLAIAGVYAKPRKAKKPRKPTPKRVKGRKPTLAKKRRRGRS
jgi:triosephosphate isomerase